MTSETPCAVHADPASSGRCAVAAGGNSRPFTLREIHAGLLEHGAIGQHARASAAAFGALPAVLAEYGAAVGYVRSRRSGDPADRAGSVQPRRCAYRTCSSIQVRKRPMVTAATVATTFTILARLTSLARLACRLASSRCRSPPTPPRAPPPAVATPSRARSKRAAAVCAPMISAPTRCRVSSDASTRSKTQCCRPSWRCGTRAIIGSPGSR